VTNAAARAEPAAVPAIQAIGIVKDFGFRRVLDGVSLEVPRGSFYTLFGPNGAGKTTLIRILCSVARPTAGRAAVDGRDVRGVERGAVRAGIGLISHRTLVYDHLTGLENLLFFARLYGVPDPRERAGELLRHLDLWPRRDDAAGTYSRGMQQRLAIARALVHDPPVLFLDEPFTGLDPAATRLFSSLLERLRDERRTALMVTHDLAEGLAIGDRWGILSNGRIADSGVSRGMSEPWLADRYFQIVDAAEPVP